MKKALLCVLLLGFLGSFAFAQTATAPALVWNGYANFGLMLWNDGTNNNLATIGSDSWTNGRLQLEGKYAASNYGWAIRLRDDNPFGGQNLYFKRDWGWVTGLNGMLTVQAGRLGDYSWSTNGWQNFGGLDGMTGVQFQLAPISGLNVGLFLQAPGSGTYTGTNLVPAAGAIGSATSAYNLANLASGVYPLTVGGRYTVGTAGYVAAGYYLNADELWLGAGYTGMSALTAKVEALMLNTSTAASNFFYVDEQVAYNMAPLNLQLYAEQQFNNSAAANAMVVHLQPSVDYTVSIWNLAGYFTYLMDSSNSGYGLGVRAMASVNANATIAIGGQYDLGTLASANQQAHQNTIDTALYDPLGGPFYGNGALITQANPQYRLYIDLVTKF